MMIAHIDGATRICGKAQGYLGLPVRDELIHDTVNGEGTPAMVTAWQPTPEELEALNRGASVHVRILGTTPPPMMVLVGPAPDLKGDGSMTPPPISEENLAAILNAYVVEQPGLRVLQDLRDLLSDEAEEMLRRLLDETQP